MDTDKTQTPVQKLHGSLEGAVRGLAIIARPERECQISANGLFCLVNGFGQLRHNLKEVVCDLDARGSRYNLVRQFVDYESTSERYGRVRGMDRSFDIAYGQRLGPQAIFETAWQMVVDTYAHRPGGSDELKFRRSIETFQRQPR
jgi:hypothetical protein